MAILHSLNYNAILTLTKETIIRSNCRKLVLYILEIVEEENPDCFELTILIIFQKIMP